jgi:hypothetical protein
VNVPVIPNRPKPTTPPSESTPSRMAASSIWS